MIFILGEGKRKRSGRTSAAEVVRISGSHSDLSHCEKREGEEGGEGRGERGGEGEEGGVRLMSVMLSHNSRDSKMSFVSLSCFCMLFLPRLRWESLMRRAGISGRQDDSAKFT